MGDAYVLVGLWKSVGTHVAHDWYVVMAFRNLVGCNQEKIV